MHINFQSAHFKAVTYPGKCTEQVLSALLHSVPTKAIIYALTWRSLGKSQFYESSYTIKGFLKYIEWWKNRKSKENRKAYNNYEQNVYILTVLAKFKHLSVTPF